MTGLDEHQVQRWRSWRNQTLVAMAAQALPAVLAATEPTSPFEAGDPNVLAELAANGLGITIIPAHYANIAARSTRLRLRPTWGSSYDILR